MANRIYPVQVEKKFPGAFKALLLTKEEVEQQSDLAFYESDDGVLFSETHDERMAFRFNPSVDSWEEVPFPLEIKTK